MKREVLKNHKGFTLVELIVVVAIIGILAGAATYSMGLLSSERAKKFVSECEAMIAQCKVNTLAGAGQPAYMKIYEDSEGVVYGALYETNGSNTLVQRDIEELGSNLTVTVKTSDGASYEISPGRSLSLGFDRSTGAFRSLHLVNENGSAYGSDNYATDIIVSYGAISRSVKMVPATGYYYIE